MAAKNIMIVGVGGQGTLLASKLLGRLLLGKDLTDNALNFCTVHCCGTPYIRRFRTMDIVQDCAGKKLCLIASLLV